MIFVIIFVYVSAEASTSRECPIHFCETSKTVNDPSNKEPAHGVIFVDGQPTVIFDTICTKEKSPWLATDEVHRLLVDVWSHSTLWLVGRYVIMPDHIHLFAWATEQSIEYDNWVRYWKSQFTKRHSNPNRVWQPQHWDTRVRSEAGYEEKWNYVRQNPVRAGLAADENCWPFQGELFELQW